MSILHQAMFEQQMAVFQHICGSRIGIFLFHGFPAEGQKNEDVACYLAQQTTADVHLLHQTGLGQSNGRFSFQGSLSETKRFVEKQISLNQYLKVILIGHSWGGFIAMNTALSLKDIDCHLVLLAPLYLFPEEDDAPMLEEFAQSKNINDPSYVPDLLREAQVLRQLDVTPTEQIATKSLIIHGTCDTVIPARSTQLLQSKLPNTAEVEFVDSDHWFTERREWLQLRIRNWLSPRLFP